MNKMIKFRTPYFKIKDNKFSHFSYWGRINYKDEFSNDCFTSPSHSSHHYNKEDQQFTGLYDKNGEEIYEGDIIEFDNSEIGGKKIIGEVIFNTDRTLSGLELGLWNKNGYYPTDFLGKMEILGNIYETPKLL